VAPTTLNVGAPLTIGACAWIEHEWMQTLDKETKAMFDSETPKISVSEHYTFTAVDTRAHMTIQ
jgi:hypothetical protein